MTVSVIIPVYNMEKYLKKSIYSIINQTYKNLEILVILDGCTDKSIEIVQKIAQEDNRIKIISKKNGGVSSARNYGLNIAHGEYIVFVDPDDWLENNAIEVALETILKNDCDIVQYSYSECTEKEDGTFEKNIVQIGDGKVSSEQINIFNIIEYVAKDVSKKKLGAVRTCWGKMYKKDIIKDIRFKEDIYIYEDGIFNLEVCNKVKSIFYINKSLYNYRIQAKSANYRFKADLIEQINKNIKYLNDFTIKNKVYEEYICYFIYESVQRILKQCLLHEENLKLYKYKLNNFKNFLNNETILKCIKNMKLAKFNLVDKVWICLLKLKLYNIVYFLNYIKERIK